MANRVRVGKGSWIRPTRMAKWVVEERLAKALPAKRTAGKWVQHEGRLMTAEEYAMLTNNRPKGKAPYVQRDTGDYTSPVDGKFVSGRRQRRYDLQRTGSRPWEGLEQEQKEVARYHEYKDKEYDASLEKCILETQRELRWKETKAEDHVQSQWLLGED